MASYVVRIWDVAAIVKERETRHRTRPAAFNALRLAVYDVLAAFGKLDTAAAWKALQLVQALDDLMAPGEQRAIEVSNTGKSVSIVRCG